MPVLPNPPLHFAMAVLLFSEIIAPGDAIAAEALRAVAKKVLRKKL